MSPQRLDQSHGGAAPTGNRNHTHTYIRLSHHTNRTNEDLLFVIHPSHPRHARNRDRIPFACAAAAEAEPQPECDLIELCCWLALARGGSFGVALAKYALDVNCLLSVFAIDRCLDCLTHSHASEIQPIDILHSTGRVQDGGAAGNELFTYKDSCQC